MLPRATSEPALETQVYREPFFSLRRPSRSILTRLVAQILIRLVIVSALPANLQAASALFPVSMLWPLVAPEEQPEAGTTPAALELGTQDAWGNFRFPQELEASQNRFAFTGYQWDIATGLYNAKARFYDPLYGRFTSQDSFLGSIDDPPSIHRYFYANDNPTRYTDPTGHATEKGVADETIAEQARREVQQDLKEAKQRNFDSDVAKRIVEQNQETGRNEGPRNSGPVGAVVEWLANTSVARKLAEWGEARSRGIAYVSGFWGGVADSGAGEALKPSKNGAFAQRREFEREMDSSQRAMLCVGDLGCAGNGVSQVARGVQQIGAESAKVVAAGVTQGILEVAEAAVTAKVGEGAANLGGRATRALAPSRGALPPRPVESPMYSTAYEARLKPGTLAASDANHFRQANRQLHQVFESDTQLAQAMEREFPGIVEHVRPGPRGGVPDTPPPGLTWHHNPNQPGVLELVPRSHHQSPGPVQRTLHPDGRGGREIWGGGR